jgi:hypothetical protein
LKLNTFDRLILLNILPREGDFTTLKIIRKLRETLSFSEEEHKRLQFKQDGEGKVSWQTNGDIEKDITIGEKATDIICDVLKKLDKDKKLKEEHFSVYEKFIGG